MLIIPYLVCASKSGTEIVHLLQRAYTRYSVFVSACNMTKTVKKNYFFVILEVSKKRRYCMIFKTGYG